MSHYLQTVLQIEEPLLSHGLRQLEKSSGHTGIDTRLIADILSKSHRVMRALRLDTSDTTPKELYHSLLSLIDNGNYEELLIDCDYVLYLIDGHILSLNMIDMVENYHHELPFSDRVISHGQRSLRGEIIGRYIENSRTDEKTTLEIALTSGLLDDFDEWYNNAKAYKKGEK